MASPIIERLIEAAQAVGEFEDRIIALNSALESEGDDPATAKFLSERIAERERHLTQKRQVLSNVIRSYNDQRAEEQLAARRNTVETITMADAAQAVGLAGQA